MTVLNSPVIVPAMARKDAPRTEQANFRLKLSTLERMDAYRESHPLHPTLTQIVEAALSDWLDAREAEAGHAKPEKGKK